MDVLPAVGLEECGRDRPRLGCVDRAIARRREVVCVGFGLGLQDAVHRADQLEQARSLLAIERSDAQPEPSPVRPNSSISSPDAALRLCPRCKIGHLVLMASLLPQQTRGP